MSSSAAVTVPHLADGPAMFFGSSIDSFALPYAAIIVIALALFVLFRAKHSGPRLKYLASTPKVTSVITRELRPAPAPEARSDVAAGEVEAEEERGTEAEAGGSADPAELADGEGDPLVN
ncbi:MAG TPA: hypothetical protein VI365_36795 [Trebonia sp.]